MDLTRIAPWRSGIALWFSACMLMLLLAAPVSATAPHGMQQALQLSQIRSVVDDEREPVLINGRLFQLEVAVTPSQQERGLMGRDSLDADGGMIFAYPFAQLQSFWMANCLIDMDIVFLDARGRVVMMYEMTVVPPREHNESESAYHARLPRYSSGRPSQFVIELQSGMIEMLGLSIGDDIHFDRARLVQMAR